LKADRCRLYEGALIFEEKRLVESTLKELFAFDGKFMFPAGSWTMVRVLPEEGEETP
jgi:hypothetical protein